MNDSCWVVLSNHEEKKLFKEILKIYRLMVVLVDASLSTLPEAIQEDEQVFLDLTSRDSVPENAIPNLYNAINSHASFPYTVFVISFERPETLFQLENVPEEQVKMWNDIKDEFLVILFPVFLSSCARKVIEGPFLEEMNQVMEEIQQEEEEEETKEEEDNPATTLKALQDNEDQNKI